MAFEEIKALINQCCSYCCRAVDFGTHDYCGGGNDCHRCCEFS